MDLLLVLVLKDLVIFFSAVFLSSPFCDCIVNLPNLIERDILSELSLYTTAGAWAFPLQLQKLCFHRWPIVAHILSLIKRL